MSKDEELLNVVDEQGTIVGTAPRSKIHKEGLLHREIHVWFYTPSGDVIFQKRGANKDTFPNLLDATVGGHVDLGDSFEGAAIKEAYEEAGVDLDMKRLRLYRIDHVNLNDTVTQTCNHALIAVHLYSYSGTLESLTIEQVKANGFVAFSVQKLLSLSPDEAKLFIPGLVEHNHPVFEEIKRLIAKR